jgi:hypothetical protein
MRYNRYSHFRVNGKMVEGVKSHEARADQDATGSSVDGERTTVHYAVRFCADVGDVDASLTGESIGLSHGFGASFDPLFKGAELLVT